MEDRELLWEFVQRQSEAAFAELVARHVELVYATALRIVGEPATAQDVAQTVFIQLTHKAWMLREGNALAGWLYRAAYRAAVDAVRSEQRRRLREAEAMKLAEQNAPGSSAWEQLAPQLDEAMQKLNRIEQNALVLHYFEGKTMREAGHALGLSGPAVQMRVGRALEKLRIHFARNGVAVSTGALAAVLGQQAAEAAPAGLAVQIGELTLPAHSGWAVVAFQVFSMNTKAKIILSAAVVVFAATMTVVMQRSREPASVDATKALPLVLPESASRRNSGVTAPAPAVFPVRASLPAARGEPSSEGAAAPRPSTRELRADLATAIPELLRILEAGDYAAMVREFSRPSGRPANMSAEQSAQLMQEDPAFEAQISALKEKLKLMQKMTPNLGLSDGAVPVPMATYAMQDPVSGQEVVVIFAKNEEGLWYMESSGWVRGPPARIGRRSGGM